MTLHKRERKPFSLGFIIRYKFVSKKWRKFLFIQSVPEIKVYLESDSTYKNESKKKNKISLYDAFRFRENRV